MSLYDDLGVPSDASQRDITAAYRRAARQHHPDAGGDPEDFARINHAAVVLRDPAKRARYDRDGTVDDQPDRSRSAAVEVLVHAFRAALGRGNHAVTDIIAEARKSIEKRAANARLQQLLARVAQKDLGASLKRLGHKGKSANILAALLEQDKAQIDTALAQLQEEATACQAALELADDYSWQVDPAGTASERERSQGRRPELVIMDDLEDLLRGDRRRRSHGDFFRD